VPTHFLKNVMMTGGLLQTVAFGAGALALDNRGTKGNAPAGKIAMAG
jgi:putative oxidoreductase